MSTAVPMYGFGGGGGAALNFKVVGNPQPASPSENTIWLNTDVPITGWYFQTEQPSNMSDHSVWFAVGTSSHITFNALKRNSIQINLLSVKHLINNELVDLDAKIYQHGEWVNLFDGYLFNNGKIPDIVTGWKVYHNGQNVAVGNFTNGSFSVGSTIEAMSREYAPLNFYPFPPIDLTPYSKYIVDMEIDRVSESDYPNYICISKDGTHAVVGSKIIGGTGRQTVELDLSGVEGVFYCGVRITSWRGADTNAKVYSMRLV